MPHLLQVVAKRPVNRKNSVKFRSKILVSMRIPAYLFSSALAIFCFACDEETGDKDGQQLPVELVPTSLDLNWQKLETSVTADDKFFILTVAHFDIPWGATEPAKPPDYCMGTCDRDRLYFYIEKSKIQPNVSVHLANGIPQADNKTPPSEGSYVVYDYFIDDPPRGIYHYKSGTIVFTEVTTEKIFGSFTISDPFASYLPKTITGEFNGVPFYPSVITVD